MELDHLETSSVGILQGFFLYRDNEWMNEYNLKEVAASKEIKIRFKKKRWKK